MNNDGRRIAFDLFYAEHATPAFRFALRLSGSHDDAEDLAAIALAKAYQRWDQFRGDSAARTWLCTIILNEWRMQCRGRTQQAVNLEAVTNLSSTFQFPNLELAEAIASLPEKSRVAFLLVKGEGMSHAEAAKVVKVPLGTMYFRVHSAIASLKQKLGDEGNTSEQVKQVKCQHEV